MSKEFTPEQQGRINELKGCSKTELAKMIVRLESGQPAIKPQTQHLQVQAEILPIAPPHTLEIPLLKMKAIQNGLKAGFYHDWQLQHLANHAILDSVMALELSSDTAIALLELTFTLFDVTGFVRRTAPHEKLYIEDKRKNHIYPVSADDIKRIMGNWGKYLTLQRQLNTTAYNKMVATGKKELAIQEYETWEHDLQQWGLSISKVCSGIDKLLNRVDSGETLREGAIESTEDFHTVTQWVNSIKKQGAPGKTAIHRVMKRAHSSLEDGSTYRDAIADLKEYYDMVDLKSYSKHQQTELKQEIKWLNGKGSEPTYFGKQYRIWRKEQPSTDISNE